LRLSQTDQTFNRPEPATTGAPTSPLSRFLTGGGSIFSTTNRFGFGSNRFQPTQAPTITTTTTTTATTEPPKPTGLPEAKKEREEYYYWSALV
jgi:hypothetical protein